MKDGATRAREEKERLMKLAFPEKTDEEPEDGRQDVTPPTDEAIVPPHEEAAPVVDDLQQKYNALLAKYNSEVPRLHSWLRDKDEKIATLTAEIATLESQAEQTALVPELDDEGKVHYISPHVTDEFRKTDAYQYYLQEYGRTYAERQAEMTILAAKSTVKPIEEQVEVNAAKTAEEQFHAALHGIHPEWTGLHSGINQDQGFCDWLVETFAQAALQAAYNSADLDGMARIIERYKSTIKPPAPAPKPTVPPHLAAPPRSGGGAQTVIDNNQGKVLKMADMEKLYADFARGLFKGKEAEYEARKREFMVARNEGRLV